MTQGPRTTETINRDNAAIRDVMHQIRELTVPDRATLALGLIGHLATMMNRSQMSKLMQELAEEAERVQDVPPSRQRDQPPEDGAPARPSEAGLADRHRSGTDDAAGGRAGRDMQAGAVGQAGRGEFRSGELL